jgi:AraC-like DNA-binding protein
MLARQPAAPLRPFVKVLWATEPGDAAARVARRERVLPTGAIHVAFLFGEPLRLFRDEDDREGGVVGRSVVGGARATYYLKDVSRPSPSVGVQLQPGAAEIVLGVPAGEIGGRHTLLEGLWGSAAAEALERLVDAPSAAGRLIALEAILLARLPRVRGVHPAVAEALARFAAAPDVPVGDVVQATGYSHRRFVTLFRDSVGLTPKAYARVLRFQSAIARLAARPAPRAIEVALDAGYSDQPHLNRDFREFAGISPERYRRAQPDSSNHVPIFD